MLLSLRTAGVEYWFFQEVVQVRYFLFCVLFVFGSVSHAADGWSGKDTVSSIRSYSTGNILIQMPNAANPGGCQNTDYLLLPMDGSEARRNQYSGLLAAYMAQRSVTLALTGCSGGGTVGYPVIEQVWLKD